MRFTNVDLLRTLAPKGLGWRRHVGGDRVPASLVVLATAMARPVGRHPGAAGAGHRDARHRRVAVDAGRRRGAEPDRGGPGGGQAVRRRAAGRATTWGWSSFAKSANVLVPPTKDRAAVTSAIDGLTLAEATATGEAVFTCLEAIRSVPADGAAGHPAGPHRAALRRVPHLGPLGGGGGGGGAGGERAGLHDRVRHRRRAGRHRRPVAAGAGGPAGAGRSSPRPPRATSTRRRR